MIGKTRISSGDADRLLTGDPTTGDVGELTSLIVALRGIEPPHVDAELVERIGAEAAVMAPRNVNRPPIVAPSAARFVRLRQRIATVAAAMTIVLASGTGLAIAADGAAPGDALYGLDRALESVSVGDGGVAERLLEAHDLVAQGHLVRGLEHAATVVGDSPSDDAGRTAASAALQAAADRIRATVAQDDVSSAVADVMTYLSEHIGDFDGQRVAELSNFIGEAG